MRKIKAIYNLLLNRDPLARFKLLRQIGKILVPNYRFCWPQMEWWRDASFNDYLIKFEELDGLNTQRRWMLSQLMGLVNSVPGDTAECGVFKGAGSYLICKTNQGNSLKKTHHVFDSFEGLSRPGDFDGDYWRRGDLVCHEEYVEKVLHEFRPFMKVYRGWIPDRLVDVEATKFSFVHVDVDLYQPTLDSISFFYHRLNSGGVLVCDDYGFTSCPGATLAMNEFFSDKPEGIVSLSCGGGFVVKL